MAVFVSQLHHLDLANSKTGHESAMRKEGASKPKEN